MNNPNKPKLDTTGIQENRERILVLAEIIKAVAEGRTLQYSNKGYAGRLGPVLPQWVDCGRSPTYSHSLDWRIKPEVKTYYVNLYPSGTRKPFQSYTMSTTEQDAQERARQGGGAFAVAVPVTVEE